MQTRTAIAHPHIAFIKYWGNRDPQQRIPSNSSISMNLGDLQSRTRVSFEEELIADRLLLNGQEEQGAPLTRVSALLDRVRELSGANLYARVVSENNFPTGTGVASSASGFAALSLAASCAARLELNEREISRLARTGSGSACRSVPRGFVEWLAGEDDQSSYAVSIASPDHWDLTDCIAVVSQAHKSTGSQEGHDLADSSPLQKARLEDTQRRLDICRQAILQRDFEAFAQITELDSNLMHAVMQTSDPTLLYWHPATVAVMQAVPDWRRGGLPACYTIDAGPNVHVICPSQSVPEVKKRLRQIPGVQCVITSGPGGAARCTANK
jgi:diphosphomevalonate decarboxylase